MGMSEQMDNFQSNLKAAQEAKDAQELMNNPLFKPAGLADRPLSSLQLAALSHFPELTQQSVRELLASQSLPFHEAYKEVTQTPEGREAMDMLKTQFALFQYIMAGKATPYTLMMMAFNNGLHFGLHLAEVARKEQEKMQ